MNLGAMVDLGVPASHLKKQLDLLNIEGYELQISRQIKNGIQGTRVNVHLLDSSHHHAHRNLKMINQIIDNSHLNKKTKEKAKNIFLKIGLAEAKIHGKSIDDIHFHEVGAIDSIVDIVGASICLDYLNVDSIKSSPVELGKGMITCAHGTFPVPAPATAEILSGIPVKTGSVPFEATTPTGAAILATLVDEFTETIHFNISKTGYGIGYKESEIPNVLRIFLADQDADKFEVARAMMIECNIDDMNPEYIGTLFDLVLEEGADDMFVTPIVMKKSRPASKISILCNPIIENKLKEILFNHTSSIGMRSYPVSKSMLKRKIIELSTPHGKIPVKISYYGKKVLKWKPEFDILLKISREKNIPLQILSREIENHINQNNFIDDEE